MTSVRFQGKPFNITVIQVYAPTSNAEEAEVERFYEDLQDLLELTPQKDILFIIGDWNAKVGSQETPGVTVKFDLGIRNEAGQRLIQFCQENTQVIAVAHVLLVASPGIFVIQHTACLVMVHRLSSCGSQAQLFFSMRDLSSLTRD